MDKLSSRGQVNVEAVMPHIPKSAREGIENNEIINFAVAENWVMRDHVTDLCREAMFKTLEPKHLSWPSGFFGMPKLLAAIARFANDRLKPYTPVSYDEVIITPGSAGGAMSLLWNICEPGDGVLIPTPYWYSYDFFALIRAGVSLIGVEVPQLEDAMSLKMLDAIEKAYSASEKPIKALLISNPHNPIGRPWTREMMEDFPDATPFTSVLELHAEALGCDIWRAHAIWSPSKLFGMSGLRLGAVITRAGSDFRDGLALSAPQEVSVASSLLVLHMLEAGELPNLIERSSQLLKEHYTMLTNALKELHIPYLPCNGTLSLMAQIVPGASSFDEEKVAVAALSEVGVVVGSGQSYHVTEKGWARITFAIQRDQLEEGIKRMKKVLSKENGVASTES